jgi:hypothetical protein
MARQPRRDAASTNPIAAAYFRALDATIESAAADARVELSAREPAMEPEVADSISVVADLLAEAGITAARPRALLGPASTEAASVIPIHPLMEYVHDSDDVAYVARSRELGFLANALIAGCSVQDRPFTRQEAWDAAIGICNLGLEVPGLPESYLVEHDLVTAFEAGWKLLYQHVSVFVTDRLIGTLADVRSVDSEMLRDLHLLRRELERNRDAGTPWRVRERLEVIAILDMPTWACLNGLLGECPVVPAALEAILGKHARSISPTAFECFSTARQIRRVREFVDRLGDILLH